MKNIKNYQQNLLFYYSLNKIPQKITLKHFPIIKALKPFNITFQKDPLHLLLITSKN